MSGRGKSVGGGIGFGIGAARKIVNEKQRSIFSKCKKGKLTASSLRISSESFDTLAVANVVERSSESIGATRVANARICTSQVTELAVFGGVAVRIFFALGN